jgi:hypothetical protein
MHQSSLEVQQFIAHAHLIDAITKERREGIEQVQIIQAILSETAIDLNRPLKPLDSGEISHDTSYLGLAADNLKTDSWVATTITQLLLDNGATPTDEAVNQAVRSGNNAVLETLLDHCKTHGISPNIDPEIVIRGEHANGHRTNAIPLMRKYGVPLEPVRRMAEGQLKEAEKAVETALQAFVSVFRSSSASVEEELRKHGKDTEPFHQDIEQLITETQTLVARSEQSFRQVARAIKMLPDAIDANTLAPPPFLYDDAYLMGRELHHAEEYRDKLHTAIKLSQERSGYIATEDDRAASRAAPQSGRRA